MGSFNIQCGISNQVISDGNRCYAVPIQQSRTYSPVEMSFKDQKLEIYGVANSMCSPGSLWSPVAPAIEGLYTDYGRISPADTPVNRRAMVEFFIMLLNSAPVVMEGENSSHDLPFNMRELVETDAPTLADTLSRKTHRFDNVEVDTLPFRELKVLWDAVWEVADENRLFCGDYSGVIRPVQFAAVHNATADRLIRYVEQLATEKSRSYELEQYLQNLEDYFQSNVAKRMADKPEFLQFALRSHMLEGLGLRVTEDAHGMLSAFSLETSGLIDAYFDKQISLKELAEKLRPMMTGVYILKAMDWLNLKFSPISYAGQDYENSGGTTYAELIADISREVTRQQNVRHEGFDEEDDESAA